MGKWWRSIGLSSLNISAYFLIQFPIRCSFFLHFVLVIRYEEQTKESEPGMAELNCKSNSDNGERKDETRTPVPLQLNCIFMTIIRTVGTYEEGYCFNSGRSFPVPWLATVQCELEVCHLASRNFPSSSLVGKWTVLCVVEYNSAFYLSVCLFQFIPSSIQSKHSPLSPLLHLNINIPRERTCWTELCGFH